MSPTRRKRKPFIAVLEAEPWEEVYLRTHLHGVTPKYIPGTLSDHLSEVADTELLSVFVYSQLTRSALEAMPKLRFVAIRGTGYDHIDLSACREKGITVANVPSYGANTVAEHTFGLILALTRKIHTAYDRTLRGDFSNVGLRGIDLRGRTLGVVGTGNIGRQVVRIAQGFEMRLLLADPHPDQAFAKRAHAQYVPIRKLLTQSDIVTLHAPLVPATKHLINAQRLRWMKDGAILINTSRGGLVDTTALVRALATKRLGGAGLDVLEEERSIKEEREILTPHYAQDVNLRTMLENHSLLHFPNVLITPHNAFNSREAIERILETTVDNIRAYLAGHPTNLVRSSS